MPTGAQLAHDWGGEGLRELVGSCLIQKEPGKEYATSGLDVLIFQEKKEMDFYIKPSMFFSICNLLRFFFKTYQWVSFGPQATSL